jgi:hypothetical protein
VRYSGAGPFRLVIAQADDDAINGLPATTYTYSNADNSKTTVIVFNLRKSRSFAQPLYWCKDGNLVNWGGSVPAETILISPTPKDGGELTYQKDGISLTTYQHQINGQVQGQIFYGALNSTTWAFQYHKPNDCGLDFYFARLLKPGEQANGGEVAGFLTGDIP